LRDLLLAYQQKICLRYNECGDIAAAVAFMENEAERITYLVETVFTS